MPTDDLTRLPAHALAARVRDGTTTATAIAEACLKRVLEREDERRAFAFIDPENVRDQARACDAASQKGPLAGVPIGIKDIIDTADMPTAMGSPIYAGHRPASDASCVALLRMAGAVIFGKTVTAEFAGSFPGATTNPHNRAHTPGGSSSGSAAAVADFMIPAALGTQTGGSVLRPSSYCGIIGFKPSFDTFNLGGVKPAAQALDTLGLHARSIDDIALLTDVLVGRPPKPVSALSAPPVIGLCRTPLWPAALPETVAAIEDAATRLAAAGAQLREIDLPDEFGGLNEAREAINAYERGRLMAFEWSHHRDQLSEMLRGTLREGYEMAYDDYVAAIRLGERCRAMMPGIFGGIDVILAPAADGAAPVTLKSAGNARFQGIWTFLHLPAITLPTHLAPGGLPVGIQLVAAHREDDRLLVAASWVLGTLGAATDLG